LEGGEPLTMPTILVTGGAGFIGSNFIRFWMMHHPQDRVINLDKLTYAGNRDNLKELESDPRYRFVHGDVCDVKAVEPLAKQADFIEDQDGRISTRLSASLFGSHLAL